MPSLVGSEMCIRDSQTTSASTGQSGGFQFGVAQASASSAPGGFSLGAGLLTSAAATTAAGGFAFAAGQSTTTAGLTGLLVNTGQTGTSALFGGARPGLCVTVE